ncbi:MAG: transporter [Christensenellaceae bacterium]|nr:transporter [Christensenellaceae bacterium]
MGNSKLATYGMLNIALLLYSLSTVAMKHAAGSGFLSFQFIALYGLALLLLLIYAFIWQKVLVKLPLTTAYANKGVVVIYGFVFGALLFGEQITVKSVIGAAIVLIGIYLVVSSNE